MTTGASRSASLAAVLLAIGLTTGMIVRRRHQVARERQRHLGCDLRADPVAGDAARCLGAAPHGCLGLTPSTRSALCEWCARVRGACTGCGDPL